MDQNSAAPSPGAAGDLEDEAEDATEDDPANHLIKALEDDPVFNAKPPSVRAASPGLMASVNELLARHAAKVRFADDEDEVSNRSRLPTSALSAGDDEAFEPEPPRPRRRRARSRQSLDSDDEDWEPGRSRARRRRRVSVASPAAQGARQPVTGAAESIGHGPAASEQGNVSPATPQRPLPKIRIVPPGSLKARRSSTTAIPGAGPDLATAAAAGAAASPSQQAAPAAIPGLPATLPQPSTGKPAAAAFTAPAGGRKRAVPALDEDGQPIKKRRERKRAEPQLGENGEPVRRRANRAPRGEGAPRYQADPAARMRSSEGVEMTRGEFDRAFKPEERRYYPGGPSGGGQYEIIATGVMWHFLRGPQDHSRRLRRSAEREAAIRAGQGANKQQAAPNKRQAAPGTSAPAAALAAGAGQPPTTGFGPGTQETTVIGSAGMPAPAARVAGHGGFSAPAQSGGIFTPVWASQLNQRLRELGLPTRENFSSDGQFAQFVSTIPRTQLYPSSLSSNVGSGLGTGSMNGRVGGGKPAPGGA